MRKEFNRETDMQDPRGADELMQRIKLNSLSSKFAQGTYQNSFI